MVENKTKEKCIATGCSGSPKKPAPTDPSVERRANAPLNGDLLRQRIVGCKK